MLCSKAKINHKDYFLFCLNQPDGAGGGGIATMVANSIKKHATKIAESNDKDEYMVIRLEHVKPALNIVHIYGRIESRTSLNQVLEGWKQILNELSLIEARQEAVLIIGDLSRAVGDGEEGVRGNKSKVSYGGSLVRDLISSGDYFILNNLCLTKGGPWTRICPSNGSSSCLELATGSINLLPYVRTMMIDKERQFTQRRAVNKEDGLGVTYTDHFPSIIEMLMPKAEESVEKPALSWNTGKPGSWEKYKEISDKVAEDIKAIAADEGFEDEEVMKKVDKILTKIKFAVFRKTKPRTERTRNKIRAAAEGKESEQSKELLTRQATRTQAQVNKVKKGDHSRVTQIFRMKDIVAGSKKAAKEAQAIKDPETNELVVSNSEIKKVTLKYCLKTLENNKPEKEFEELIQLKTEVHKLRMEDKDL